VENAFSAPRNTKTREPLRPHPEISLLLIAIDQRCEDFCEYLTENAHRAHMTRQRCLDRLSMIWSTQESNLTTTQERYDDAR
jgi:hypothetical protein